MQQKPDQQIAVVTGGGSGIGLAIARRLAEDGAQVVIKGRRQAVIDEAVASLGAKAIGLAGEVGRAASP